MDLSISFKGTRSGYNNTSPKTTETVVMCRLIVLLAGLLTFVSGHPPPDHDTGCDVTVIRLEKMLTDLTRRVHDLENQRQADVMEITNFRQDMEKVKTENRQLKTELDHMITTKCDRQPQNPGRRVDIQQHNSGSNNSQSPTFDSKMDAEPSINDTKTDAQPSTFEIKTGKNKIVKEQTVNVDDTGGTTQEVRIRRDDLHLTNRVVSSETVAFFSTVNHELFDVGKEQIIQFGNVVTNNGGHYNEQSGVFTCGTQGTYVFSWTLYVSDDSHIDSELVKNGNAFAYSRAGDANYYEASSTTAVVNLSPGDMVWTRVKDRSPGADIRASVSMFCGFKI
ncbi:uncharacterized protein LOC110446610 [Mizuhopecten yessoensis]|uniref:Complement C1q-like protein 3 n=1 Tax=Mizuhopecten yessoensis TaxID=6573 RepID=A0A210QX00_MIZYE|nr:uncharacterized protein LOC110446610 [Mizuhopecten yessoensis]OWF53278.1 Complement C1q-like protein 3 [Mizuhopecten yessoensis]